MYNDSAAFPPPDMEQALSHATLGAEGFKARTAQVNIHVYSVRQRLADADGISAKAIVDACVLAGLLQNDSPEHVKEVSYSQEKGETEYTVIKITEARLAGMEG